MRELAATLTNIYYKRLRIHIVRNGLTFIEDVRDRQQWTRELLRKGETTVMEVLPEETVVGKMRNAMYEAGLDMVDQRKFIYDLFDGQVNWEKLCPS